MCQIKYYDPSTMMISWEIREQPQVPFICRCAFEIVSVPYISNKIFMFLAGRYRLEEVYKIQTTNRCIAPLVSLP